MHEKLWRCNERGRQAQRHLLPVKLREEKFLCAFLFHFRAPFSKSALFPPPSPPSSPSVSLLEMLHGLSGGGFIDQNLKCSMWGGSLTEGFCWQNFPEHQGGGKLQEGKATSLLRFGWIGVPHQLGFAGFQQMQNKRTQNPSPVCMCVCACACTCSAGGCLGATCSWLPAVSLLTSLILQTANSHQPREARCASRVPAIPVPWLSS